MQANCSHLSSCARPPIFMPCLLGAGHPQVHEMSSSPGAGRAVSNVVEANPRLYKPLAAPELGRRGRLAKEGRWGSC